MKIHEAAWLIERPGVDGPEWLFARDKGDGQTAFGWSNDSNEAVKFETKDEADAWRRGLARITPALISGETTASTEPEFRAWDGARPDQAEPVSEQRVPPPLVHSAVASGRHVSVTTYIEGGTLPIQSTLLFWCSEDAAECARVLLAALSTRPRDPRWQP